MARVIILQGPGTGREYDLQEETVLGRLETNGIPIEDTLASREHARIERRDGCYTIVDLGSSNGTYVNGRKITKHALRTDDRIVIGKVRMRFDDPDAEPVSDDVEPEIEEASGAVEAIDAPAPASVPEAGIPERTPRAHPQQYWLLLGCMAISIGCLTVWEREQVSGRDVYGFQMIVGAFTLLLGVYGTVEGALSILQGRLKVAGAFAAGLLGLLYGLKAFSRTLAHEGFLSYDTLCDESSGTHQAAIARWAGQIGPGVWLTLFGALVIAGVFARALLKTPKGAPASAQARHRS